MAGEGYGELRIKIPRPYSTRMSASNGKIVEQLAKIEVLNFGAIIIHSISLSSHTMPAPIIETTCSICLEEMQCY